MIDTDSDGVMLTYVFEQSEVRKTGRQASRALKSGKTEVVYEITPTDSMVGSWKKWVRDDLLMKVDQ